jgi:hypothetical protein
MGLLIRRRRCIDSGPKTISELSCKKDRKTKVSTYAPLARANLTLKEVLRMLQAEQAWDWQTAF